MTALPFASPAAVPEDETAERYRRVRALSTALTATLSPEDQLLQSMEDASPAKWHLAHTTWFFETFVLTPHLEGYKPFHPAFAELFNSYYEVVGGQFPRKRRNMLSRPGVEEVAAWRAVVDQGMEKLLARGAGAETLFLVTLGLNHEQQHQELLLTDIKHAFFQNPLLPVFRPCRTGDGEAGKLHFREYEGGLCALGRDGEGFAFDNERPRHRIFLEPFAVASRLVTNAEYLAFIEEGGYRRPELWLSEGWAEIASSGRLAPLYWLKRGEAWQHFTHGGMRPAAMAAPVAHVSYFEADAFARWKGARLPTEGEWEHAAGASMEDARFLDLEVLAPRPADGGPQFFGDCWEWTSSAYAPYPGFTPFTGLAAEYNGKFMCRQMVLRGGSALTPEGHLRPTYRNFFSPSARWQMSGIRLAKDIA